MLHNVEKVNKTFLKNANVEKRLRFFFDYGILLTQALPVEACEPLILQGFLLTSATRAVPFYGPPPKL